MNVILVSNRCAQSRSIYLNRMHIALFVMMLALILVCAVQGVRSMLIRPVVQDWTKHTQYDKNSLDAMAVNLGEIQARVQRLDVLGGKLVKFTGMKPSEFQFDQPPAQGGPLISPAQISAEGMRQQLASLSQLVEDRSDKLMALQTLLMQDQLSRGLPPASMPVSEGVYTSNFGWRVDPITGKSAMHEGVDFTAEVGTSIHSASAGVVVYADTHPQYGNMVEVDHGNDIVTRYAHASRLLVKVGQVVRRGDKIAEVGSTGRSTGNHLHFEVRYKGMAQNPARFLQNAAG